jgi:hypothetical protein
MNKFGWQKSDDAVDIEKEQISFMVKGVTSLLAQNELMKSTIEEYSNKIERIEAQVLQCTVTVSNFTKNNNPRRSVESAPDDGPSRKQVATYFSKQFNIDALELLKEYGFLTDLR